MFTALPSRNRPRRGVTLVEMLVVVALVVLMMVILVQIFQSALGAMSASRTTQELDVTLRQIDSMVRSDLTGVTANMTPPNDPALKQGYFEYGEGAQADAQGEDTDDYMAFTTKAPEGQNFTGRQYLFGTGINATVQPTTITSQVAEIIYFLRNGNLYRRVLLVAPEKAKSLTVTTTAGNNYTTSIFGGQMFVSWQGMNDISCRPVGFTTGSPIPIPNDLGDLTNRENRIFRQRFANDFNPFDGIPDDNNNDGVPDYAPTLYYNGAGGVSYTDANNNPIWSPNGLTNERIGWPQNIPQRVEQGTAKSADVYAFPYLFPGMYSVPEGSTVSGSTVTPPANNLGWRHGMFPGTAANGSLYINHAPLDVNDNLPAPTVKQTWWGFPTWRETMTAYSGTGGWGDPVYSINRSGTNTQALGLRPLAPQAAYMLTGTNFLTPLTLLGSASTAPPPYSDGAGSASFVALPGANNRLWEDDLILTNVRSFDIKAYDPDAPLYNTPANGLFSVGYLDLGYGAPSYLGGWASNAGGPVVPPFQTSGIPQGFGHEARMPPITNDFRIHPKRPLYRNANGTTSPYNIGDNSPGVTRLVRTFDTWSTAYIDVHDTDLALNGSPNSANPNPIYPSFPPPYPSTLRGLQVQIRVTDARGERTKVLTIRHNFPR